MPDRMNAGFMEGEWRSGGENNALEELSLKFRQQVACLNNAAIVSETDKYGNILYVNDLFCRISKYSREELIGQNHRILKSGKQDQSLFSNMWKCISKGDVWHGEIINRARDGSYYWVDTTITPFKDSSGQITKYVSVRFDITAQKRALEIVTAQQRELELAKEELLDSKKRLEELLKQKAGWLEEAHLRNTHILNSIDQIFFIFERRQPEEKIQFRLKFISPQVATILGIDPELILAHPELVDEMTHPESLKGKGDFFKRVMAEKKPMSREIRVKNLRTGEYLWLLSSLHPFIDKNGDVIELFGSMSDITAEKRVEEEKTVLIDELSRKNERLSQFANTISHNLRGPVANIQGLVHLMHNNPDPREQANCLAMLDRSAHNLDSVIVDLNKVIAFEYSDVPLAEMVDMRSVYEEAVVMLSKEIEESGIILTIDFFQVPKLNTIRAYLLNIFYNLISNAIKYRYQPNDPRCEIMALRKTGGIELVVWDNGLGMDLEMQRKKLFNLYSRFHPHIPGKGLGLYLMARQVQMLGGNIDVESVVKSYTKFSIRLPAEPLLLYSGKE